MDRVDVLRAAGELINGDRARQYGEAHDTHARIGQMWAAILGVAAVSPAEVALCMDAVKSIRAAKNPQYEDSWVDKAGYSALGGEFATEIDA